MIEINQLTGRVVIRGRNEVKRIAGAMGNPKLTIGTATIHIESDGTYSVQADMSPADYVCLAVTGMGAAATIDLAELSGFFTPGRITYLLMENGNGNEIKLTYTGMPTVYLPKPGLLNKEETKEISVFLVDETTAVITFSDDLIKTTAQ